MADLAGPLQISTLRLLWKIPKQPGAMTVHQIHASLNEQRAKAGRSELAYTTILTVMRNLARRKFVLQTKSFPGRSHLFTALVTQVEYEKRALQDTLDVVFDRDKVKMIEAIEAL